MWCGESREYVTLLTSAGNKLNRPGMLVVVKLTAQNLASISVEFFAASEQRATYVESRHERSSALQSCSEVNELRTKSAGLILIFRGRALYSELEGRDSWMASRNFRWYKWVNKTWGSAMLLSPSYIASPLQAPQLSTAIPHAPHWCCHN